MEVAEEKDGTPGGNTRRKWGGPRSCACLIRGGAWGWDQRKTGLMRRGRGREFLLLHREL